jgi:hypothetical protein
MDYIVDLKGALFDLSRLWLGLQSVILFAKPRAFTEVNEKDIH